MTPERVKSIQFHFPVLKSFCNWSCVCLDMGNAHETLQSYSTQDSLISCKRKGSNDMNPRQCKKTNKTNKTNKTKKKKTLKPNESPLLETSRLQELTNSIEEVKRKEDEYRLQREQSEKIALSNARKKVMDSMRSLFPVTQFQQETCVMDNDMRHMVVAETLLADSLVLLVQEYIVCQVNDIVLAWSEENPSKITFGQVTFVHETKHELEFRTVGWHVQSEPSKVKDTNVAGMLHRSLTTTLWALVDEKVRVDALDGTPNTTMPNLGDDDTDDGDAESDGDHEGKVGETKTSTVPSSVPLLSLEENFINNCLSPWKTTYELQKKMFDRDCCFFYFLFLKMLQNHVDINKFCSKAVFSSAQEHFSVPMMHEACRIHITRMMEPRLERVNPSLRARFYGNDTLRLHFES